MKKRYLITFMAAALTLALASCGGSSSSDSQASANEENAAEDEAPEADAQEEAASGEEAPTVTFESQILVDNEYCAITITGIEDGGFTGDLALTADLENKSDDITYRFAADSVYINGVEASALFSKEVAPGKKSKESITLNLGDQKDYGMETATVIELALRVYDTDDWMADKVVEETFYIYPYGEENAVIFEREPQETDLIIAQNDSVEAVVLGYEMDSIWGYGINLYLVNNTGTEVMFSVDDASVNGYMADPFWANSVKAGKTSFSTIHFSDSKLEEIDITDPENEIEEIEFVFKARDNEDFLADSFFEETITLNP